MPSQLIMAKGQHQIAVKMTPVGIESSYRMFDELNDAILLLMNADKSMSFKDKYMKLQKVATGTYGVVYKGKKKQNDQFIAIKKFLNPAKEGIPPSAIREINITKSIKSDYVLPILDVYVKKDTTKMVTLWKSLTLSQLISSGKTFNKRKLCFEILKAIDSLHSNHVMHRDLKPQNIVLNDSIEDFDLKIIDLGMAKRTRHKMRTNNKGGKLTSQVGTMYYQAPELLQKSETYDESVDIWALGCIFYQIFTGSQIFKGTNCLNQLILIYSSIASPEEVDQFVSHNECGIVSIQSSNWKQIEEKLLVHEHGELELDLLRQTLRIEKSCRVNCSQLMSHAYFSGL